MKRKKGVAIIQSNTGSNGRRSGALCCPHGRDFKNGPAQLDSGISNLGVLRILRILGGKAKNENGPAQRDSKMSNLVSMDIVTKKGVKEEIFTMRIKNKILFYPLCLVCCNCTVFTIPSATWEPTGSSRGSGEKE
jgi:hypothetical protein